MIQILDIIINKSMVFKLRDKSLFWTRGGWKNNWNPKYFNVPRPVNSEYTMGIRCRYDHHSFLRLTQSYRNYSRIVKQYLYGDRRAEQLVIFELRSIFRMPYVTEVLTDQIKHGGQRRFADQLDRDYELMSYNTHPEQLFMYELQNKAVKKEREDYQIISKGGKTVEMIASEEILKLFAEQKKRLPPGEEISLERKTELILQVMRVMREALGQSQYKKPNGQLNDFLQQRRPYTQADPSKVGY